MSNIPRESVGLQNPAMKMQDGLNINLPPNYQLYAKSDKGISEHIKVNFYPRLGENNPQTSAARKSKIINFDTTIMKRLDLEELINPQAKDVDLMNRELHMYREQVRQQNEEVQKLEDMRNRLAEGSFNNNNTMNDRQQHLMQLRNQKEELMRQIQTKPAMTEIVQPGNFFESQRDMRYQSNPQSNGQQIIPTGNFFDQQEEVYLDNFNSHNNGQHGHQQGIYSQRTQDMNHLEQDGYHFY